MDAFVEFKTNSTMRPEDELRVHHLVEAAQKAIIFSAGHKRADLETDEVLRLALTKLVEIVGEAARQVSDKTQAAHRDVPWSSTARARDRLIHHDFDIDLNVLWATIKDDLPALLAATADLGPGLS